MDLQPRKAEYGPGRHYANAEIIPGRLTLHLRQPLKMGGLQINGSTVAFRMEPKSFPGTIGPTFGVWRTDVIQFTNDDCTVQAFIQNSFWGYRPKTAITKIGKQYTDYVSCTQAPSYPELLSRIKRDGRRNPSGGAGSEAHGHSSSPYRLTRTASGRST